LAGARPSSADKTGRVCRGVELEPLYVDVIVDRATAITALRKEVTATGPWMDMVRQAAFAGFIALDELATFRELPDYRHKKSQP
jgi:hypothetical protein